MTFYNIIFGILFVGACQQFLLALVHDTTDILVRAVIALMVINDTVHTSDYFESQRGEPRDYRLVLKWLDLLGFTVLGLAILSTTSFENETMGRVDAMYSTFHKPWFPWLLLFLYWCVAIVWNWQDGAYASHWLQPWPNWMKGYSVAIGLVFAFCAVVIYSVGVEHGLGVLARLTAFIIPLPYILFFKHKYVYWGAADDVTQPRRTQNDAALKDQLEALKLATEQKHQKLLALQQTRSEWLEAKREFRHAQHELDKAELKLIRSRKLRVKPEPGKSSSTSDQQERDTN